jgi:hypothetical protein
MTAGGAGTVRASAKVDEKRMGRERREMVVVEPNLLLLVLLVRWSWPSARHCADGMDVPSNREWHRTNLALL